MLASSQDLSPLQSQCCPRYRAPGAVADLPPATISTGLHIYTVDGAVYNLATATSRFPYLGLSPSASGRDDDQQPGTIRLYGEWDRDLRIGACMDVTLMALHEGPVPLTHASERGHETVTADRALIPHSVVGAGKAAFYGSTR